MALTLDSAPSTRQLANNQTTLTFAHTYGGGSGAVYLAVVVTDSRTCTATWNAQSMTELVSYLDTTPGNRLYLFWLRNPSGSGAQNIVVTASSSATYILASSLSLLGSINATAATNSSVTTSVAQTLANGSWMVGLGYGRDVDAAASTNFTSTVSANPLIGYYGPKSGSGSLTLNITVSSGAAAMLSVEAIDDNASGGGSTVPINVVRPNQATAFSAARQRMT